MSMAFDPANDFETVVDQLEPVMLTWPDATVTSIERALRRTGFTGEGRAVGRRVVEAGVIQGDVIWHLPASEVPCQPPLGSVITDSQDVAWTVLMVEHQAAGRRWRCHARNLTIAHGLDRLIQVQVMRSKKGPHGESKRDWQTSYSRLAARIQPESVQPEVRNDALGAEVSHIVYLAEDLELGPRHRIVDLAGTSYVVLKTIRSERIGELMQVWVREQAEG